MQPLSLGERASLAAKIQTVEQQVAESVTGDFLARHPDWITRYGDRARVLGVRDAIFHQRYLACGIQAGAAAPFAEYARWTVSMLGARNIAANCVGENLELIGQVLQPFLSSGEYKLVSAYIDVACTACLEVTPQCMEETGTEAQTEVSLACSLYVEAAIRGDRREAAHIAFEALQKVKDVVDLYVDLFQAAQYEVGRRWQANQITVAEEHMATAITQYVIGQVYSRFEDCERNRGRVVITGIEGELHQLGANMVADVIEARGWNVRFLGTNLPHDGILQAIQDHKAETVGISATTLLSIPKAVRLVEALRDKFPNACPRVILGGRAFLSTPELAQELNAAGPAIDLRAALALL